LTRFIVEKLNGCSAIESNTSLRDPFVMRYLSGSPPSSRCTNVTVAGDEVPFVSGKLRNPLPSAVFTITILAAKRMAAVIAVNPISIPGETNTRDEILIQTIEDIPY
jgi:hypothetical protein